MTIKKNIPDQTPHKKNSFDKFNRKSSLWAFCGYTAIAVTLTYPLIVKMSSSVYGFYDHITTDMFASLHYYFWWIHYAVCVLKTSPIVTNLFAAPFGSRMIFTNFTGFAHIPITAMFGYIASYNIAILFNLIMSGLGMFFLVRYITKNTHAGFIAGIIYAFCPNMMVRSYTTFDSTQVQWLPLYTLFVIQFIEHRTWKHALLTGVFLICNILFAMPYFLVYLPIHTIVILGVYSSWYIWGEKQRVRNFIKDITTQQSLKDFSKIAVVLIFVGLVFLVYYKTIVGGGESMATVQRTTEDLSNLALKPLDYLMPHPRSFLLKGNIKESYWNAKRPGKDPDSFVAYIGYVSIALAIVGILKGRGKYRWLFIVGGVVAFWSTVGHHLLGIPTPSGIIHSLYAPFARRILMYKTFVQMNIAGLAGMGIAVIFGWVKSRVVKRILTGIISLVLLLEYAIVPPALSVDLTYIPDVYKRIRDLPEDSIIIEVPLWRNNGYSYQGYVYYQTIHKKRLFNPAFTLSKVPPNLQPFYTQMYVPLEASESCNLAVLRYLGVTHLNYHWYIGTQTVIFRSFGAPGLVEGTIDGLRKIYRCTSDPRTDTFPGPYDYTFTDLYEITAEPCPVVLTFDYTSPYKPIEGIVKNDVLLPYGWASALVDTSETFYYPLNENLHVIRLARQGGQITVTNISHDPIEFSLSFTAKTGGDTRTLDVKWNDSSPISNFRFGPEPTRCEITNLALGADQIGILSIWSPDKPFLYPVDIGVSEKKVKLPAIAVVSDFKVTVKK